MKSRTPSGSTSTISVDYLRTIFSPSKAKISEKSTLKVNQPYHQRLQNSPSTDYISKSTVTVKATKTRRHRNNTVEEDTDQWLASKQTSLDESDNFYTPPATPRRSKRAITPAMNAKTTNSQSIKQYLNMPLKQNDHSAMDPGSTSVKQPNLQADEHLTDMEGIQESETVQTLDLQTVMSMFTKLNNRLQTIEDTQKAQAQRKCDHSTEQVTQQVSQLSEDLTHCKEEIKMLKRENFILDRAAKLTLRSLNDVTERLEKLELTHNRRMASISGLYVYSKKKDELVQEIEYFIRSELGTEC